VTLAPGARLGPYEILSPLGAGGMGEVYRARDPRLGREVAIKVLPAAFSSDPDRLRRFEQEAKAAGSLNHPNITAVYDVGSVDGAPYVVSELLEGETLRSILAGRKLSTRKAIDYAVQIAHGLAAAHEKGIVHRDLKPENLFVTKDGRVKILDFGLAKLTREEIPSGPATQVPTQTALTEPGVVMGTVGYISPEQVRGSLADARSDIFSFGAILYEMLSGNRAFQGGSTADTISAILKEDPLDLTIANPSISAGLGRIVRHCLEKSPEERFQSAQDLGFDLSVAAGESPRPDASSPRRTVLLSAGAVLAALLVLVAVLLWRTRGGKTATIGASALARKSIAVLPFQNLSPEPENAYFADGMTEDILTQLAKIRDLKVISRSSVMQYKGTQKPIKAIAAELGVGVILEGSVRRSGDRVRIVGQLIDARTDEHLWAETYDRELKDVFSIQSEVAQQIAASLQATLSPAEKKRIEQRPTENLLAYDLYLKGREHYNRLRKEDNETAIEHFQKALEADPGFALAYAGLGDAYAQRALRFGFPQTSLDSSLEQSRKAISLAPGLPEGHKARGLAYQAKGAYRESVEANLRAVELAPNHYAAIINLGSTLFFLGRLDEALRWSERASELAPTSPLPVIVMGSARAALDDPSRAEALLRRAVQLQPDLAQGRAQLVRLYLRLRRNREALEEAHNALRIASTDSTLVVAGETELLVGDPGRAREIFERFLPLIKGKRQSRTPGAGVETHLAYLHLRAGRRREAEALLAESLTADQRQLEGGNQDWSVPFDTACVHALRGEKDEAFHWLDRSVEAGWRGWPLGTRSPLLDSVRSDPRLQQIEARLQTLVSEMRKRAGLS